MYPIRIGFFWDLSDILQLLLRARIIAYIPIVLSFAASGLTALIGAATYSVGAGVLTGLMSALIIQIIKEHHEDN